VQRQVHRIEPPAAQGGGELLDDAREHRRFDRPAGVGGTATQHGELPVGVGVGKGGDGG
jgi:hypothetical protein